MNQETLTAISRSTVSNIEVEPFTGFEWSDHVGEHGGWACLSPCGHYEAVITTSPHGWECWIIDVRDGTTVEHLSRPHDQDMPAIRNPVTTYIVPVTFENGHLDCTARAIESPVRKESRLLSPRTAAL